MKKSNAGALMLLVSILVVAQIVVAQMSTPQPTQKSASETKQLQPRHPPQRQKQQQQIQQQLPQAPPQQQQQQQTPQQQPTPEQQQKRRQARAVHRSTPPPTLMSFETAQQRRHREHHPRDWWAQRYPIIVLVGGGYYYFDSGYWFPALGYDPNYEAYDYDGPIYTYGNLLPDQVILNVQRALTDLGYFAGVLSGALSPATRSAISAYQQDNGLVINGVVDAPLVYSLGLQ
jgi:hypothetical protein